MNPTFLEYEVALILAKYGKSAVLGVLSQKLDLTQDELQSALKAGPDKKTSKQSHPRLLDPEPIEAIVRQYPKKAKYLRELCDRFQDRSFLPELRDVKRFFEQRSRPFGSTKSRADSLSRLLQILAEMDSSELAVLCEATATGAYSSLGIIADEILRKHG